MWRCHCSVGCHCNMEVSLQCSVEVSLQCGVSLLSAVWRCHYFRGVTSVEVSL